MNENKLTRDQAIAQALAVEEIITQKVAPQYLGMPREELKEIILFAAHKTTELKIFCYKNELNFHEITGR